MGVTHFGVIKAACRFVWTLLWGSTRIPPFGVHSPFVAPTFGEHPPLGPTLGLTHLRASASPRGPISRNSRIDRGSSGSAALRSTRSPPGASSSPSRGPPPAAPRNRTSRSAPRIPCGTAARDEPRHTGGSLTPGDPTPPQRWGVAPPGPQNPPRARGCPPGPALLRAPRTSPRPDSAQPRPGDPPGSCTNPHPGGFPRFSPPQSDPKASQGIPRLRRILHAPHIPPTPTPSSAQSRSRTAPIPGPLSHIAPIPGIPPLQGVPPPAPHGPDPGGSPVPRDSPPRGPGGLTHAGSPAPLGGAADPGTTRVTCHVSRHVQPPKVAAPRPRPLLAVQWERTGAGSDFQREPMRGEG